MTSRATRASRAPETGANAPRVLWIEDSHLAEADEDDGRERLTALRAAGARVRAVSVSPRREAADSTRREAAAKLADGPGESVAPSALSRVARSEPHDLILIASPHPHGGPLVRHLPGDRRALWISTGFAAPARWRRTRPLLPAFGPAAAPGGGLDGCVATAVNGGRTVLPLWDGDYVLAPMPLEGRAGGEALTAFAKVAAERSGIDLVVLADPQPAFERLASRLGVGPRVHFVGTAPRGAQRAWWSLAAAAILAGERPIAGGIVLRGLEARCPMVAASSGAAAALGRWLAALELGPRRRPGPSSLAVALEETLERGDATHAAIARGLALSRDHAAASLTARFAALLREGTAARRAA